MTRNTPHTAVGLPTTDAEVSVIIPTYDEADTIGDIVKEVHHQLGRPHEIIVVDDSPDAQTVAAVVTAGIQEAGALRRRDASGLASAVLAGVDVANGDKLVVMDGDGQHPPGRVPALVDALNDADVAVGSRHAGGRNHAHWGFGRVVLSFGASGLAWLAVPDARTLQDPMSGMFAIRRELVEAVRDRLEPRGYKLLLELLAQCPIDDVAEVPINFTEREAGESNMDSGEIVDYVFHLSRLALEARRRRRPYRSRTQEVTGDAS